MLQSLCALLKQCKTLLIKRNPNPPGPATVTNSCEYIFHVLQNLIPLDNLFIFLMPLIMNLKLCSLGETIF